MSTATQVTHRPVSAPVVDAPPAGGTAARPDARAAAVPVTSQDGDMVATSAWVHDERPRPGRLAGVALGALGMLLGVLVGLAALAATAVDLAVWTLKSS